MAPTRGGHNFQPASQKAEQEFAPSTIGLQKGAFFGEVAVPFFMNQENNDERRF
ncbi:hypothetical protein DESC_700202 [Desulfosarcina cetonica]|nr:hypothetical protein DESC_700202 [Desulfosarcina cetonica]